MGGRGASSDKGTRNFNVSKNFDYAKSTYETRDVGFGSFQVETSRTETPEGAKILNALQRAAVGTEITIDYNDSFKKPEIYRITGTTSDKRLIPKNAEAKESMSYSYTDEYGELKIPSNLLRDREALSDTFYLGYGGGTIQMRRTPLTREEIAAAQLARQRKAADKRQLRLF